MSYPSSHFYYAEVHSHKYVIKEERDRDRERKGGIRGKEGREGREGDEGSYNFCVGTVLGTLY